MCGLAPHLRGGAEHESLAALLLGLGKQVHDFADLGPETLVQQAVCLVEDQGVEARRLDAGVAVAEDVLQSAGRTDQDVATLALNVAQAEILLRSSYCRLHNDLCVCNKTLCLHGDLLGQLAGG